MARHRQAVPLCILSRELDLVAGQGGEVGEDGSQSVPRNRHGHIMSFGVLFRLKLDQIELNVVGVYLPRGPEASGSNFREGQVFGLDQFWRRRTEKRF